MPPFAGSCSAAEAPRWGTAHSRSPPVSAARCPERCTFRPRRPRPRLHLHDGIPGRLSLSSAGASSCCRARQRVALAVKHPLLAAVGLRYTPTSRQAVSRRPVGVRLGHTVGEARRFTRCSRATDISEGRQTHRTPGRTPSASLGIATPIADASTVWKEPQPPVAVRRGVGFSCLLLLGLLTGGGWIR